jgi:hypothetical protein
MLNQRLPQFPPRFAQQQFCCRRGSRSQATLHTPVVRHRPAFEAPDHLIKSHRESKIPSVLQHSPAATSPRV